MLRRGTPALIFTGISVQNASVIRSPSPRHHRLLAGVTRSRLLAVLQGADAPLAVRELANAVGLHPNSVREQLELLVDAGLVARTAGAPSGRGRPSLRYTAIATTDEDADPYRQLAQVLAEELASLPDPAGVAAAAGDRWGRSLVAGTPPATDERAAVQRLVALLDDAGFAPEPVDSAQDPIQLRRCPFVGLARDRGDVVCSVHLGLMRGALRELGAPLDAVSLEPFVRPDLCLAHLGDRRDG